MYIGAIPTPAATESRQEFLATANQTVFNTTGGTVGYCDCFLNGVKMANSDFSFDGADVTLTTGAAAGDVLAVVMRQADNALVALPIKDSAGNNVLSEANNVVSIGSGVQFPAGHVIGIAFLADVNDGHAGGSSTSYTLRQLNTVKYQINCPITITSNEITFDESGSYVLQAIAPALKSDRHIVRLSDDSGSSFISSGSAAHTGSSENSTTSSFLFTKLVVGAAEITGGASERSFGFFTIVDAAKATDGLGNGNNDVTDEEVLQVQIFRVSE